MPRLPQPGGDQGEWGSILNDYLSAAHNTDGTLKPNTVTSQTIAPGSIALTNLTPSLQSQVTAIAGQQGATGPTGPTGATGPQGPQGLTGASGTPGTQGATGSSGPQGPAGTPGSVGATGASGAQGTPGSQGAVGATGPTGPTGPSGPAGADGTSVTITGSVPSQANLPNNLTPGDAGKGYITEDNGHLHVWSGTSFTDVGTVRGPSGAVGATGPSGAPGATGATGPSGAASTVPGATGPTGATGATGPAGTGNVRFYTGSAWQARGSSSFPVTFDAGLTDPVPRPTDWLPGDHIISLNPPVAP